jgi:putative redox protein
MSRERVGFPGGGQGAQLAGRLESPEGEPAAYALFAHCFTCSKDLRSAGGICRELIARGIAVLRFDFTGLGDSEGEFGETNFTSNVEDLVAAADYLGRERQAPALLVGHSLGGTAMLAAAARIPEAVAVAVIGAPSDTGHLIGKLAALGATAGGDADAGVEIDLGGSRPVRIRRQLLADLAADHLRGVLAHLGKALLIFHSPVDQVVGIEHAERLFLAARHPKSFVSLGSADHLLSDPRDAAHAGAVLAAWAGRYLPEAGRIADATAATAGARTAATGPAQTADGGDQAAVAGPAPVADGGQAADGGAGQPQAGNASPPAAAASQAPEAGTSPAPGPALGPGEVEVFGTAHSLRQEVRLGAHHLVADEPVADGGGDAGPTPYGLLLASLGACTGMTMRLYADRKQLPLAGTRVRLRHSRDHATDCADCAESDVKLDRIERELELFGPLAEDQRARLLAIANRCPVHRTLSTGFSISTKLV